MASRLCATNTVDGVGPGDGACAIAKPMAQKRTAATFRIDKVLSVATDLMSSGANNNSAESIGTAEEETRSISSNKSVAAAMPAASSYLPAGDTAPIRHVYVHIPFCARICPYCAFYKELLDRSSTDRFCEAILHEIEQCAANFPVHPQTIFFGGGTPTALPIAQLTSLLRGFEQRFDLSTLTEWTIEANPGSVSARKAALLLECGVNRISLGVQSWDNELLTLLGREHNASQAEESFQILRRAGFSNINIDLMFGLPGQTAAQWEATVEKTVRLQPDHISAYCLTYEEDTDFFVRQARGELHSNADLEANLFELAISMLEDAGYDQYEISNYARPGYASVHNRAYWAGEDYLGIGPSAFSTAGMRRWQNVSNYREYADRILSGRWAIESMEELTAETKRTEKIALSLRTSEGMPAHLLAAQSQKTREFVRLGLLARSNGNFVLTRAGKCVADSVAEAFV
jgi:putative oxygen-independent coproporphyrinogen III oxidase